MVDLKPGVRSSQSYVQCTHYSYTHSVLNIRALALMCIIDQSNMHVRCTVDKIGSPFGHTVHTM